MKLKIPQQSIDEVLSLYKPEQRLLREATLYYPAIEGRFRIGESHYLNASLNHATDIEIQLCLNQLAYTSLYEAIRLRLDSKIEDIDFKKLQREGMLIIESHKRFRKPIPINKDIAGSLEFSYKRKGKVALFYSAKFQFEDKSYIGNLEFAIINQGDKK